jgi:hypothetical protein
MHLSLERKVRASFSLTLKLVASKTILRKQSSSAFRRQALSMIVNLHQPGLHRATLIRSYQSASSLVNFARRALLKNRLMKLSMASMMNPNIAWHLI